MMALIPATQTRHPWHLYAGFAAIPIVAPALMAMLLSKPVPLSVLAEQTPCVAAVLADQLGASPDRSPVTEWDRRGAVSQCERATASQQRALLEAGPRNAP
mgnify:CR=1 FL=1